MKNNFQQCFVEVLKHEGGYVNHPNDPGKITNLGVTKKVWDEWTGKDNSASDMKALTPEMVKPLYENRYWDACKCDDLPAGIDYCVFDTAVNSGRVRAVKFLQSVVGTVPDGAIGPITIDRIGSTVMDIRIVAADLGFSSASKETSAEAAVNG